MSPILRLVPPLLLMCFALLALNLAKPLLEPGRLESAQAVCDRIGESLRREPAATTATLFLSAELAAYLGKDAIDPWGAPYRLEHYGDGSALRLRSAGPDHVFDSSDDVFSAATIQDHRGN